MLRIRVSEDWSLDGFRLYVLGETDDGKRCVVTNWEMRNVEPGMSAPEHAALPLSHEAAQELLDELLRVGVLPTNGIGSPAHVKALQAHIADLQRLVFAKSG